MLSHNIGNFRDYGGYRTSGGFVASGKLYRSAELTDATPSDWQQIVDRGIVAIVDLRGLSERNRAPWKNSPPAPIRVICSSGETTRALHTSAAEAAFDVDSVKKNMTGRYAETPFRPLLVEVYKQYFDLILEVDGGTLLHCTAGKDRTGILVALIQYSLGVHHDDILTEYLLTNSAADFDTRVANARHELELRFGSGLSDEVARALMCVFPEYLESAFESIQQQFGTIDRYLDDVLGVSPARRERLGRKLVVNG